MRLINRESGEYLYHQVIAFIENQMECGALKAGEKLPSLRKLGKQLEISIPTVKQAYLELEKQGRIIAKPQSGYYLQAPKTRVLQPRPQHWAPGLPVEVKCRSLIEQVIEAVHLPNTVPLGISNPVSAHPPDKALARLMRSVISKYAEKAVSYGPANGDAKLRMQLAFRYQDMGINISQNDIIITNGAQEALAIALKCVAKAGDTIAVESPCYFGMLELIESLGMKALEVYTCAEDGVWVPELAKTLQQHQVTACIFSTAINNPLGSFMLEEQRKALVQLLEQHNIPLIEDDVYSDLYFTEARPKPAQYYSEKGLVITCSSFSKTAAPGYRVGWLVAPHFEESAKRFKRALTCSTPMLQQWTLTEYLMSGDYDRHLAVLRKRLATNAERMKALICQYFPDEVRVSDPKGGSVLWVRCRSGVNTHEFFFKALEQGVSFAPGAVFSPSGKYQNFMRISFGVAWDENLENAVKTLGKLVKEQHEQLG